MSHESDEVTKDHREIEQFIPEGTGKQGPTNESSNESKLKRGWRWFYSDMRRGRLAWVKIVFFLQTAGLVTLYPYLTIHMR